MDDSVSRLGLCFRRLLKKNLPTREVMAENRFLKPVAHRILASELWRFTRRSVPRGVALGFFAGFILPVGQIVLAAFLALPARANVPVAVLATFITNPLTFPFWIWLGNRVGRFVLQIDSLTHGEVINTQLDSWMGQWLVWIMQQAGVTAIGLAVLSVVAAGIGYVVTARLWSWWIGRKWNRRARVRRYLAREAARRAATDEED